MNVGDRVILTGDNFQIPNVGLKGQVTKISKTGWVHVEWDDLSEGWFSPHQTQVWICKIAQETDAKSI